MKLKLDNKTGWNTRDLRKLCLAVCKKKGITGSKWRRQTIIITKSSRQQYHGLAWLNVSLIKMKVPGATFKAVTYGNDGIATSQINNTIFDVRKFSQILEHEIDHNLGLRHRNMDNWRNHNVEYTKDFDVRPKVIKPKLKHDIVKMRWKKATDNVKKYQTKLKRTKTLLNKWQKKVKYYEKKQEVKENGKA